MTADEPLVSLPEYIGPYRILGKLGEGGIGVVLEGRHQAIERSAAIKLLRSDHATTPEVIERFFNEARAAGRINHPGIVQILDFGRLPRGDAYLAMELLSGESLSARLKRGPPSLLEALRFTWQTASALAAAHLVGIVHRDIKPDNLMLVRDPMVPGGERVKIVDFGIAKLAQIDGNTRTGMVMGTPAYMAPEQCRADREINDRADVYALGVMLFRMLTGQLPFLADGLPGFIYQHLFVPPPSLRSLSPRTSECLDNLVQRLLAKEPNARPAMAQVVTELQKLLSQQEGSAPQFLHLSQPIVTSCLRHPEEPLEDENEATSSGQRTSCRTQAKQRGLRSLCGLLTGGVCVAVGSLVLLVRCSLWSPSSSSSTVAPRLNITPVPLSIPPTILEPVPATKAFDNQPATPPPLPIEATSPPQLMPQSRKRAGARALSSSGGSLRPAAANQEIAKHAAQFHNRPQPFPAAPVSAPSSTPSESKHYED